VPDVFAQVADPVSAGFVASLAKPGGNMTGFTPIDYEIGVKWREILKEIAPSLTRVGVIRDPTVAAGYVDQILRGTKPADLPVQASTKFAMTINMRTAKALGLTVPPSLLSRADEVNE
jgi:ABC-type uncharacterized transport system substrate-binding protein